MPDSFPYSQTLRLNRICFKQEFLDKRCNEIEGWLIDRGYSAKLVRQQVLKARQFNRKVLLNKERKTRKPSPLAFNLVYHPALSNPKLILEHIHLLLTPDSEHCRVFAEVPIIAFRKGRSLKDLSVRAKVLEVKDEEGGSNKCGSKRCNLCTYLK